MLVREIMDACSAECTEDTPLGTVYEMIQKSSDGFVVVIDSNVHRVPIGIVTERSICEQVIVRGRNPRSLSAGNVMDTRMVKVASDSIADGLDNMVDESRTSPFIVINEKRELCGVVPPRRLRGERAFEKKPAVRNRIPDMPVPELPAFGWA